MFEGSRGSRESAKDFIEEVELFTELQRENYGAKFDKYRILVFRTKLTAGKPASAWYSTLPIATRTNWDILKQAFMEKFGKVDTEAVVYDALRELTLFERRDVETAGEYISRAYELNDKLPVEMHSMLVTKFIMGLKNEVWTQMMSVTLGGKTTGKTLDNVVQHLKNIVYPFGQGESVHLAPRPVEQDSNKLLAHSISQLRKTLSEMSDPQHSANSTHGRR